MREILSLQFGHYANFIGTHFWNAQVDCVIVSNSFFLADYAIVRV
jgi:hypothetical protein